MKILFKLRSFDDMSNSVPVYRGLFKKNISPIGQNCV